MEKNKQKIYKAIINTPLGDAIACSTPEGICFFDFVDRKSLDLLINVMIREFNGEIIEQKNSLIEELEKEINEYFLGKRKEFTLSLILSGTDFQKEVWQELLKIPYGEKITYLEEAISMNRKKSVRAVANANGKNKLSILIPCHRVVGSNGKLGGYGGGIDKKKYLLDLENKNK